MTGDPILATLAPNREWEHGFRVEGGLHMIRGNHAPYFSLTYTEPGPNGSGGAGHEVIVEHFPQFEDLAALHLSDIDGVPMHAEANGWYQLAGAMGGLGERYHAGNSRPIRTETECLAAFARHCRIDMNEAYAIRSAVQRAYAAALNPDADLLTTIEARAVAPKAARAEWRGIMEAMRPRWKREAEECIARHGLRVYGDPWTRPYVIAGPEEDGERLYWSNADGWVDRASATVLTDPSVNDPIEATGREEVPA